MRIFLAGLFVAAVIAALTGQGRATDKEAMLTIAGDPCSVPLITRLVEAYSARDKSFRAEVSTYSCTLGVYKAAGGEVDLGVSTQNGLAGNLPREGVNTVIAMSPVVLVVNRDNPVDGLSYDQVKGIYSGAITNWKELGGADLEIKNVMLEPCVRHTISKQVVPYSDGLEKLTPGKKVNPVEYTNRLVAGDPGAMGQQIYGYESRDVKVLKIDGVLPDDSTLPGSYTFYQDFNIVTHHAPSGAAAGLIDFAFTGEGKEVIRSLRHVPVERAGGG